MLGFLAGGVAIAWGVLVAALDQAPPSPRTRKLCTALLVALSAVAVVGGVTSVAGA
ncbi:hypothetical protein M1L60_30795 [Actinoplanes sp. TRM 88003]|uniref:Uncharacterized protein n=1 Tax=Paractinoplanes aksuensis TaxID=2939490 RepID=A0ABT1DWQ1_9ACTN|nr:hypothetical protein [Actinoplanes aksuensis]MCO8274978.1 hypothetical protein [Actinoplanes aksuensis]